MTCEQVAKTINLRVGQRIKVQGNNQTITGTYVKLVFINGSTIPSGIDLDIAINSNGSNINTYWFNKFSIIDIEH